MTMLILAATAAPAASDEPPIVVDWRDHPQTPGRDEPAIRKAMAMMMNSQELLFLS